MAWAWSWATGEMMAKCLGVNKVMRIAELKPIKPIKPLTPSQMRIKSLKQTVARSKDQLTAERDRQRRQREQERLRKRQAQVGGKTL